jgi:hypothetical protein
MFPRRILIGSHSLSPVAFFSPSMEESIFIDDELQGVDGNEDESLFPSTSSLEHVLASIIEAEAPQATTSSTTVVEASQIEGEIVSERGAPSHIQKAHPPQQIIGNLNEGNSFLEASSYLLLLKYDICFPL